MQIGVITEFSTLASPLKGGFQFERFAISLTIRKNTGNPEALVCSRATLPGRC